MSDERESSEQMQGRVFEALRDVVDPELGLNIVDLGLVYGVDIDSHRVHVRFTMTTLECPLGDLLVRQIEDRVCALDGVDQVQVELVWEPAWSTSLMSPSAKAAFGWEG